jgi:pyochelin biosynthetic protein PchC
MTAPSSGSYLRRYRDPREAAVHLVCFPHAGGSAAAFRDWTPLLPPSVRLTAIQYSGRQDRINDAMPESMAALADEIWRALAGYAEPTLLFGHSFGATVAFEVARQLERRGPAPVVHLVASGRPGPGAEPRTAKHLLGDDEMWADMVRLGGTDGELASLAEVRDFVLPGLRRDYFILETYRPAPGATVACPVTAFLGADDTEVSRAQAKAWARATTTGAFRMRIFEGAHFYLSEQPAHVVSEVLSLAPATT